MEQNLERMQPAHPAAAAPPTPPHPGLALAASPFRFCFFFNSVSTFFLVIFCFAACLIYNFGKKIRREPKNVCRPLKNKEIKSDLKG